MINKSNDHHRKNKKMTSSNNNQNGSKVIFQECKSDQDEVHSVIEQISKLYNEFQSQCPAQLFDLSNIAILYRTSSQTRIIEEILNRSNLKYAIAGGVSFYQRKEIMEITTFLKALDNDRDDMSLTALFKTNLNYFKGIGDKMIEKIIKYGRSQAEPLSFQQSLFKIQKIDGISPKIRNQIKDFLKNVIIVLRRMRDDPNHTVADLIQRALELLDYHHHLQTVIKDKITAADKWANVMEFVKIAREFDAKQTQKKIEFENDSDSDMISNDNSKVFALNVVLNEEYGNSAELLFVFIKLFLYPFFGSYL